MWINDTEGNVYHFDDTDEILLEHSEMFYCCEECGKRRWGYHGCDDCEDLIYLSGCAKLIMKHGSEDVVLIEEPDDHVEYVLMRINKAMRTRAKLISVIQFSDDYQAIRKKQREEEEKKREEARQEEEERKNRVSKWIELGVRKAAAKRLSIGTIEDWAQRNEEVVRKTVKSKIYLPEIKQAMCKAMGDKKGWWNE